MIEFRTVADDEPALNFSPLLRGVQKTFAYVQDHGSIGLTPSKAFKRNFVHWAAAEFNWPGHSEADLFAVNKVLNEHDFMPLGDIHFLLTTLKMGRHYKGNFKLTQAGSELIDQPGRLFGIITPFYLFELNHTGYTRFIDEPPLGNWDMFMNILNVEAEDGITGADLRRTLYGDPDQAPGPRYDDILGSLYLNILRPLCWAGLLHVDRSKGFQSTERSLFTKTPLWKAALKLKTDSMVQSATRH